MAEFDWLFGNPRDLARTPPFMPGRPAYRPDDGMPLPTPQQPQQQLSTSLPDLPMKPKKGVWSQIAGEAVGLIAPALGDRIQYGDYPDQMRDYQRNIERQKLQADLEYKARQADELRTRSQANVGREALFGAQQMKALREDPLMEVNPGHSIYNRNKGVFEATAPALPAKTGEFMEVTPEVGKRFGVMPNADNKFMIPAGASGNLFSGVARGMAPPDKSLAGYRQAFIASGKTEDEADELAAAQFMADRNAARSRTTATASAANARAANAGAPREDRNAAAEVKRLADRIQADETTGDIALAIRSAETIDGLQPEVRQRVVDELKGRLVKKRDGDKKKFKGSMNFNKKPAAGEVAASSSQPTARPSAAPPPPGKDPLGIR